MFAKKDESAATAFEYGSTYSIVDGNMTTQDHSTYQKMTSNKAREPQATIEQEERVAAWRCAYDVHMMCICAYALMLV